MPNTPPRPAGVPVSGMLTANQSPKVRHATPAGVHVPVSAGTYAPFTRATQSSRGHSPSTSSNAGFPPFQQRHQSYAPVPAYQHNPGSGYLIPYHSQSVTPQLPPHQGAAFGPSGGFRSATYSGPPTQTHVPFAPSAAARSGMVPTTQFRTPFPPLSASGMQAGASKAPPARPPIQSVPSKVTTRHVKQPEGVCKSCGQKKPRDQFPNESLRNACKGCPGKSALAARKAEVDARAQAPRNCFTCGSLYQLVDNNERKAKPKRCQDCRVARRCGRCREWKGPQQFDSAEICIRCNKLRPTGNAQQEKAHHIAEWERSLAGKIARLASDRANGTLSAQELQAAQYDIDQSASGLEKYRNAQ